MDGYGRSPIHSGLIVMVDRPECHIRAAVLDLEELLDTGFVCVRGISAEAFRLPSAKMNLELSVRKNLERRLERTLIFGDMIEYNLEEHLDKRGLIRSFEKLKSFIPSRIKDGEGQILLEGIVNPNDTCHFYTSYFRNITIPTHLQKEALPNVYLQAWITLYYRDGPGIGSVDYEFDSFHGVCSLEKQFDVGAAPWNKLDPHFSVFVLDDDDEEDDIYGSYGVHIENPKKPAHLPDLELYKREAYMTGDRSFLLLEFPQFKCLAPLKKYEANLQIGSLYSVDCFWNRFEKIYMVSNTGLPRKPDTRVIDPETKLLRCNVKEHHKYRGIFHSDIYGFMDDPDGILGFLHLSKNSSISVPVAIVDDGPSRCGQLRFRLVKVLGETATKLQNFMEKEIVVPQSFGVVVEDNSVFSAFHSPLLFAFNSLDNIPPIGSHIIFEAKYDTDKKKFYITSWELNTKLAMLPTEKKRMVKDDGEKEQTIFQVKVRRCPEAVFDKMFCCDEFGIIDDNLGIIPYDGPNGQREYDAWLGRSHAEMHVALPRTPFHIVATGRDIPDDRYKAPAAKSVNKQMEKNNFYHELTKAQALYDNNYTRRQNEPVRESHRPDDDLESVASTGSNSSGFSRTISTYNDENLKDSGSNNQQFDSYSGVSSYSARGTVFEDDSNLNQRMNNFHINDDRSSERSSHFSSVSNTAKRHMKDDASSLVTDEGSNDYIIHKRKKDRIPLYNGPVLANDDSEYQYDVVETLSRLKEHIPHGDCGSKCTSSCPYIMEVAKLVAQETGFWEEAQKRYPAIAYELVRCFDRFE